MKRQIAYALVQFILLVAACVALTHDHYIISGFVLGLLVAVVQEQSRGDGYNEGYKEGLDDGFASGYQACDEDLSK